MTYLSRVLTNIKEFIRRNMLRLREWNLRQQLVALISVLWLAFWVLDPLFDGKVWWWDLFSVVPAGYVWIVMGILMLLAWWQRVYITIFVVIISSLIWWPQSDLQLGAVQPASIQQGYKIFSWNTLWWSEDDNQQKFWEFLTMQKADIYHLQEAMDSKLDPVNAKSDLQKYFPGFHYAQNGELLTISRFPIKSVSKGKIYRPWGNFLRADLLVGKETLSSYNIHLPVPLIPALVSNPSVLLESMQQLFVARNQSVESLLVDLHQNRLPKVVSGDFNSTRLQAIMNNFNTYTDAAASKSNPTTFYFNQIQILKLWRIDWLFGDGVQFAGYVEHDPQGMSDHWGISSEFEFTK